MLPSRRQAQALAAAAVLAVLFAKRRKIVDRLDRIIHTWSFLNDSLLHGSRIGAILLEDINRFLLHPHGHAEEAHSISGLPQSIRRVVALLSSAEVHAAVRNLASGLTQGVSDGIWSTGLEALHVPAPAAAAAAAAVGSAARGAREAADGLSRGHQPGSWGLFLAVASRALQGIAHQLDLRAGSAAASSSASASSSAPAPSKPAGDGAPGSSAAAETAAAVRAAAASGEGTAVLAAMLRASLVPGSPLRRCGAPAGSRPPRGLFSPPSTPPLVLRRLAPPLPPALPLRLAPPAASPPRPAPVSAGSLAASHAADLVRATVCAVLGDTPEQRASAISGAAAATTSAAVRAAVEAGCSVLLPRLPPCAGGVGAARGGGGGGAPRGGRDGRGAGGAALVGETARCPEARALVLELAATVVREAVTSPGSARRRRPWRRSRAGRGAGAGSGPGRGRVRELGTAASAAAAAAARRAVQLPAALAAALFPGAGPALERLRAGAAEGRRPSPSPRFVLLPLVPFM
eukprot:tig00020693_g13031.t1